MSDADAVNRPAVAAIGGLSRANSRPAPKAILPGSRRRLLIISRAPFEFADWLDKTADPITCMETRRLLVITPENYMPLIDRFDGCLLIMGESEMRQSHVRT